MKRIKLLSSLAILVIVASCSKKNNAFVSPPVVAKDVYVAGFENNGTNNVVKVWKNGIAATLTDGSTGAYANSVFVSDTNVYIAGGYDYAGVAKLWTNGLIAPLPDAGNGAVAQSVFVNDNDVYTAGFYYAGNTSGNEAVLWKNGVATSLTDGQYSAFAYSVFASGTDVYVAGSQTVIVGGFQASEAVLWKNGMANPAYRW